MYGCHLIEVELIVGRLGQAGVSLAVPKLGKNPTDVSVSMQRLKLLTLKNTLAHSL
jgi:hypothetical protein